VNLGPSLASAALHPAWLRLSALNAARCASHLRQATTPQNHSLRSRFRGDPGYADVRSATPAKRESPRFTA